MERAEILLLLDEIVELPPGSLTGVEALDTWDSLMVISLIAIADEQFNRRLSSSKVREFKTVNDVVAFLQ